ncbi:MAG TPA: DUF2662 domain-containing protein [Chloroflexi bacterium]|nr:DUF2662 domain-containing protein [Chloroflexota bacterium]
MNKIARFESLAERLVEGTFARLFADRLSPLEVVRRLARSMEDHQAFSPVGIPQAPTHYWVRLNPHDLDALNPDDAPSEHDMANYVNSLERELAQQVAELANQMGLALRYKPTVRVLPDEAIAPHDVHIEAAWMPEEAVEVGSTMQLAEIETAEKDEQGEAVDEPSSRRPFLILGGERHVDLHQPVVSIGRALDNDIILEDPRVSRHHAQLRRRYGRYVLYDLRSSGGTQINGYPIEECVLHSGDVISLAGAQIIYGEDPQPSISLEGDEDTPLLAHE